MSGTTGPDRVPGDEPTRRWDAGEEAGSGPDAGVEWTRPWVVAPPPPPPAAAPTRPLPPADQQGLPDGPAGADDTAALDRTRALEEPWEGTAEPYGTGARRIDGDAPQEEAPSGPSDGGRGSRRGRDVALLLVGSVLGFVLAFLIVAWSTGGDPATEDGDTAAVAAEMAALEEQVGALEAERDEANARTDELEAQLAEAEAAAGERDDDVEAQRQALDERAAALDDRATALDGREDQLDQREASLQDRASALDERERQLDEREAALDAGETPTDGDPGEGGGDDGDGDGGGIQLPDLPEVDTEEVGNVVERVLDWLRDLF
jgi:hypothetical protein